MKRVGLSEEIVTKIKIDLADGMKTIEVKNKYGLPYTTIREIKACHIWAWVYQFLNEIILKHIKKVHKRIIPHKGVKQIDPITMKVIRIFKTQEDAAKATGAKGTNIGKCCRGLTGYVTAGGYRWAYIF